MSGRGNAVCFIVSLAVFAASSTLHALPLSMGEVVTEVRVVTQVETKPEFVLRGEPPFPRRDPKTPLFGFEQADSPAKAGRNYSLAGDFEFDRIGGSGSKPAPAPENQEGDRVFSELYRSFAVAYPESEDDRTRRPERLGRGSGPEFAIYASDLVQTTENLLKEAITGAIEKGMVEATQQDFWELGMFLGNVRQFLTFSEADLAERASMDREYGDGTASQQRVDLSGQPLVGEPQLTRERGIATQVVHLGEFIGSLLTEPVTIVSALVFLIMARVASSMGSMEVRTKHRRSRLRRSHRRRAHSRR